MMTRMKTHLDPAETETGHPSNPLDLRGRRNGGRSDHGAAYGFDEDVLVDLLTESSRSLPLRSPIEAEMETLETTALSFL